MDNNDGLTDREIALIERVAAAVAHRISIPQHRFPDRPSKVIKFSVDLTVNFSEAGYISDRDAGRFRDGRLIASILQRILQELYPRYDQIDVRLKSKFNGSEYHSE